MFLGRVCTCRSLPSFGRSLSAFSADSLLRAANRSKCVKCLQKTARLPFKHNEDSKTHAAVLIPICVTRSGEVGLLFTRRSGKLSRHVRQVAFPGGIKDPTDNSYEDCALRETEEEIGLPRSRVQIWGSAELIRFPGNAAIMPVVGSIENFSIDELKLNKDEVDEAFVLNIETLCSQNVKKHTQFKRSRISGFSSPVFVISPQTRVWGITAYMTNLFLNCFVPKGAFNSKFEYIKPIKYS